MFFSQEEKLQWQGVKDRLYAALEMNRGVERTAALERAIKALQEQQEYLYGAHKWAFKKDKLGKEESWIRVQEMSDKFLASSAGGSVWSRSTEARSVVWAAVDRFWESHDATGILPLAALFHQKAPLTGHMYPVEMLMRSALRGTRDASEGMAMQLLSSLWKVTQEANAQKDHEKLATRFLISAVKEQCYWAVPFWIKQGASLEQPLSVSIGNPQFEYDLLEPLKVGKMLNVFPKKHNALYGAEAVPQKMSLWEYALTLGNTLLVEEASARGTPLVGDWNVALSISKQSKVEPLAAYLKAVDPEGFRNPKKKKEFEDKISWHVARSDSKVGLRKAYEEAKVVWEQKTLDRLIPPQSEASSGGLRL